MPIVIMPCYISVDGTGDFFTHFINIYNDLKEDKDIQSKGYEFIPLILCQDSALKERVKLKLEKLGANVYFVGGEDEKQDPLYNNSKLKEDYLKKAEQVLQISNEFFPDWDEYIKHAPANILKKYIGEHEQVLYSPRYDPYKRKGYSTGLSSGCYGLFFNPSSSLTTPQALSIIKEKDNSFIDALFHHSNTNDVNRFTENNELIPAYFNRWNDLNRFLKFISINKALASGKKNVSIYLSGNLLGGAGLNFTYVGTPSIITNGMDRFTADGINRKQAYDQALAEVVAANVGKPGGTFSHCFYAQLRDLQKELKDSDIGQIEIIEPDGKGGTTVVNCIINPEMRRKIQIYYGYYLSDISYQAIHQQAKVAGVSGDGGFQNSTNALPIYHSTNCDIKQKGMVALAKIIEKLDFLDENLRKDYMFYFRNLDKFFRYQDNELVKKFKEMNLNVLIENWPKIVGYLIEHHNFRPKLKSILFAGTKYEYNDLLVAVEKIKSIYRSEGGSFLVARSLFSEKKMTAEDAIRKLQERVTSGKTNGASQRTLAEISEQLISHPELRK